MKQTITMYTGSVLLALILAFGAMLIPAYAHDGEDHSDDEETTATLSVVEMERLINLMQQLVTLLTTLRTLQPAVAATDDHGHDEAEVEMETHHDEHATEETAHDEDEEESETGLVIEIEPHNNQTHVHVRYVDKPEEMFFVNVGLDDEDGIVRETSTRTGLSEDEVREALKYMQ